MTAQFLTRLRVEARYNGPPHSANGGYICGLIAQAVGQDVGVRLYKPPPLDTDMDLVFDTVTSKWHLKLDEQLIAAAHLAKAHAHVPPHIPGYDEAVAASLHFAGHQHHIFPSCFVCGPQRADSDGLRVFAGKLPHTNMVAATWTPHVALAAADNKVAAPFVWAALDCPGYFASISPGQTALLGEFCVCIDHAIYADEPCVIVAWPILIEGRKHKVGTALFDEEGEQCAIGVATWVEIGST